VHRVGQRHIAHPDPGECRQVGGDREIDREAGILQTDIAALSAEHEPEGLPAGMLSRDHSEFELDHG
jgi:hypothetical protein